MDKLTVSDYQLGDSRLFTPKKDIFDDSVHDNIENIYALGPKKQWMFTIFLEEEPVAVIGGTLIASGVVELFSIMSEEVYSRPVAFARTVERCMTYCQKKFKFHRYQTLIKTDEPYLHKWAKFLKMEAEGVLRQLYAKQDHTMYARLY